MFDNTLLADFHSLWPNLDWPKDISSSDKEAYSPSFLKELKALVAGFKEQAENFTFQQTAVVILWKRIETEFKPEVVQKKTKLKTPKLGALESITCTKEGCGNESGIWKEQRKFSLTTEVALCCTICGEILSEPVQIIVKEKAPAKPREPRALKAPAKPKKPTKKDNDLFDSMKMSIEQFGLELEIYQPEEQEVFNRVKAWREENVL
jgi:hypothetical protein